MVTTIKNQRVVQILNELLEREFSAVVRYLHHSLLVFGPGRGPLVSFLREKARDSMGHAVTLGEKITALGGIPSVKVSEVLEKGKHSVEEMLSEDLDAERRELERLKKFYKEIEEDVALRLLFERQIEEEQGHVEELEKYLRKQ